jgi:hypothetical protein
MSTSKIGTGARKAIRYAGLAAAAAAVILGMAAGLADAATASQAQSAGRMYGDPAAAAPYWRAQTLDDCALMASADVIGQLIKREVSEREIVGVAQSLPSQSRPGPVYALPSDLRDPNRTGRGTNPQDIPVLLARYGITAAFTSNQDADRTGMDTGMEALERYLAGGHKVIVGLNAELIWGWPVQNKDGNGNPAADHAVVVTGVDTASATVHLNDSGTEHGKDETVPIEVFARSWAASDDRMIVTAVDQGYTQ